eukprot:4876539-Prymnesium_polylepis.1
MASRGLWDALALVKSARVAAEPDRSTKARVAYGHGDGPSPCHSPVAPRPGCSTSDFTAASAAEPVTGCQPVSMMQNISDNLLDG